MELSKCYSINANVLWPKHYKCYGINTANATAQTLQILSYEHYTCYSRNTTKSLNTIEYYSINMGLLQMLWSKTLGSTNAID